MLAHWRGVVLLVFSTQGMCMFVLRPDTESEVVIGFDVGYYAPNGVFVMLATFVDHSAVGDIPSRAGIRAAFKSAAAMVSVLNGGDVSAMPPLNTGDRHGVPGSLIEEWDCYRGMMPDGLGQFGAKVPDQKVVQ